MSEETTPDYPVNDWGHTMEQYSELWETMSTDLLYEDTDKSPFYKYISRLVSGMLFNHGHPRAGHPYELLTASRAVTLSAIRWLILEGYIELTEKGTREVTGEEVSTEVKRQHDDDSPGGMYL